MKILVQDSGKTLTWKDAIYKDKRFRSADGCTSYEINSIYAIKDDNRNKITVCSACGAEIPNTPAAIRAHRNMVHKSNKCFDCYYLKPTNEKMISQKYVLNEDGSYAESTKRQVRLSCKMGYRSYDINSEEAKTRCRYSNCEHATFGNVQDFWTRYPNAFDEFITVDRVLDSGYKQMYKQYDHLKIELKGRANIIARVNDQGVCYEFTLHHRQNVYAMRYSKKYDKVWVCEYGDFRELHTLDIADSTQQAIIEKMRTLYK